MNKPLVALTSLIWTASLIYLSKAVKSSCHSIDVQEGNDVNVTCTFQQDIRQSKPILYVYHNEETIVTCTRPFGSQNCFSKRRNYHIVGPITNQLTLNIAKVTRSDGGHFRCIAEGSISDEITPCLLNVAAVASSCRNLSVKEGSDVNVTCTFYQDIVQTTQVLYVYHNEETIVTCTWPFGSQNCFPKRRNYHIVGPITNQLTLNITKVTRSDGGQFRCIPEGSISDEIIPCHLNVVPPASSCRTMSMKKGNDVKVICTFAQDISQSKTILYVFHNEETVVTCTWPGGSQRCIPKGKSYSIVGPITNQLTLKITNVTRTDGDHFSCIPEGSISDEITPCLLNFDESWRVTNTLTNKLQVFVKSCLCNILKIRWTDKLKNTDLWQWTNQDPISQQIARCKWRNPPQDITQQVLQRNSQGKRRVGRPKTIRRQFCKEEMKRCKLSWGELKKDAQNRLRWRAVFEALCSTRKPRR